MDVIPFSTVSANLAVTMDRVCDSHEPIVIDRPSDRAVVMISLEDYEALEETAYLLRSPANAKRLFESIAELESGGGIERELLE